jgi:two-component system, response regulator PdtaR
MLQPQSLARPVVLTVIDDVLLRLVTANSLRGSEFEVIEAVNATEAMQVLSSVTVDALFSQLELSGGMGGLGLARWVRQRRLDTRIMLTSDSATSPGDVPEYASFLPAPFVDTDVERLLRNLLPPPQAQTRAPRHQTHQRAGAKPFIRFPNERDPIGGPIPYRPLPTVLVVENGVLERFSKAANLRRQGLEVFEAVDMAEAVTVLEKIAVNVLISDVNLVEGTPLSRWLQKHQPATQIVRTTARGPDAMWTAVLH